MLPLVMTLREAGPGAYVQLGLLLPALLWALVCAVLVGMRWKVPPIVAGAPLLAVPIVLAVGMMVSFGRTEDALVMVDPAQRITLVSDGIGEVLAQPLFGLLVVPVAFVLGVGALAAGVRGPRGWGIPAIAFAAAGLTAVLPAAGLFFHAPLPWVIARVLLYAVCVVPLALALANGHPKANGPEAGMLAAMAWISLVGAVELAYVGAQWMQGFAALVTVEPDHAVRMVASLETEVGAHKRLSWFLLVLAAVPAVAAGFRPTPPMTDEEILAGNVTPSPWRSVGRVLGLGLWVFWAAAWGASSPVSALMDVVRLSSP